MTKMAANKTKPTDFSVDAFINALPDERKRSDSRTLITMMEKAAKEKPKMWGHSIIGFGNHIITSSSGRMGEWPVIAFSPRKAALTLYLTLDIKEYAEQLSMLGKHKTGLSCLYITKLEDIDLKVLDSMIRKAMKGAN